jgi:hypothetical protein
MALTQEAALIEQAKRNEVTQKSLRSKLGVSESAPFQVTAGFTISAIENKITDSLANTNMTGWMFLYNQKNSNNEIINDIKISDIIVKELEISLGINTIFAELKTPELALTINPFIHYQLLAPGTATPQEKQYYPDAVAYTGSGYISKPNLRTPSLAYYSEWTRAAFIRRTDLQLLRDYLMARVDESDDVFFSGAFLDYDSMQNARLRVEQLNTDDIENTSQTFTLKAEPFSFAHIPLANADKAPTIPGPGTAPEEEATSGVPAPASPAVIAITPNTKIPLSFAFVPCPPYWRVGQEAPKEYFMLSGGYDGNKTTPLTKALQGSGAEAQFLGGARISARTESLNLLPIITGTIYRFFSIFKGRPTKKNNSNLGQGKQQSKKRK